MKIDTEIESPKKYSDRLKTQGAAQKRALVVCEETGMCTLIGEVLGSAGVEAVNLMKNVAAENQFQGDKFDVVLVDMATRPEFGIELVQKIRKSGFNQKTPIIMISEDQHPGALSRAFQAGASFFVYKPIDKPHFVSLIRIIQGTIDHERRRFRRVPIQTRVGIKSDKGELVGETIDISMNGTLVRTPRTLPVGCLVEVSLFVSDGTKPIVGLGSVMRIVNNNQMGILLDRMPIAEIGRLQEFLLPRITD